MESGLDNGRLKVLVISFSHIARDPRVRRQIKALSTVYDVSVAGFFQDGHVIPEVIETVPVACDRSLSQKLIAGLQLLVRRQEAFYYSSPAVRQTIERLSGRAFDVIVANDLDALPLALQLARNKTPVLFDAHEYAPREFEDSWRWRLLKQPYAKAMCRRYLHRTTAMITVCEGIAEEYQREYGLKPAVVVNAPYYEDLRPTQHQGGPVRLVHHGGAMPSRRLELMIDAMKILGDRYTLDFLLMPTNAAYMAALKRRAEGMTNIRFLPPVPMVELAKFCNQYDAGLYLLPPTNFNNLHALPNKFFEFVQARIPAVIGPSPEMSRLVARYGCGLVSNAFTAESIAETIRKLTPDAIRELKVKTDSAARELCYERSQQTLLDVVASMVRTEHSGSDNTYKRHLA